MTIYIELLSPDDNLKTFEDIVLYFNKVKDYLKQNEETYKQLTSSDELIIFFEKLKKITYQKILSVFKSNSKYSKNKYLELDLSIFIDGTFE